MNYLIKFQPASKTWLHEPVSNDSLVEGFPDILGKVNPQIDFVCMFNGGAWSELNAIFHNPQFQKQLHVRSEDKVLFVHLIAKGKSEVSEQYGDLARLHVSDDNQAEFWKNFLSRNFRDRTGVPIEEMSDILSKPSLSIFRLYRDSDNNAQSIENAFVQPIIPAKREAGDTDLLKVDELYEATEEYFEIILEQILRDKQRWLDSKSSEDFHEWLGPVIKNAPRSITFSKLFAAAAIQFFAPLV